MWLGNPSQKYAQSAIGGLHVLVLERRLGRKLTRKEVAMHTCDNPRCVLSAHIRLGSQKDNVRDAVAKGRRSPFRSLSRYQRAEIKARYLFGGISQRALAREYGVSQARVNQCLS